MILIGETELLGDRSASPLFEHKQPYTDWLGSETEPKRRETTDNPCDS